MATLARVHIILNGLYRQEMNDYMAEDVRNLIGTFIANYFEEDWILRKVKCSGL